jgi:hypothetical protein
VERGQRQRRLAAPLAASEAYLADTGRAPVYVIYSLVLI